MKDLIIVFMFNVWRIERKKKRIENETKMTEEFEKIEKEQAAEDLNNLIKVK